MSDYFNYNNRRYYFSPPLYTWLTEHAPTSVVLNLLKNIDPGKGTEGSPVTSIMTAFNRSHTSEGANYWVNHYHASRDWIEANKNSDKKISQDPSKFKEVI